MLSEGLPGWERKGYVITATADYRMAVTMPKLKPGELQALLQKSPKSFVLIDIREADEYADGHIGGAINIPLTEFARVSAQVPAGKKVIVYCSTGARNYSAYRQLRRLGYSDISEAVLEEWEDAGLKVERGGGAVPAPKQTSP